MDFKQGLFSSLFCIIIISFLRVDGERVVSDIPGDTPNHIPADTPSEFPTEFPTEFPNEVPRDFSGEVPSEFTDVPKEEMVMGNSRTPRRGCSMNVCFALDGSDSISPSEFERQRFLARAIVETLPANEQFGLAAVQYNVASTAISPLTLDRNTFISRVSASRQAGDTGTFLVAGINFCFSEIDEPDETAPLCGINKIIVMGDGRGNIGADPAERAREFERRGGEVFVVAFGSPDIQTLTTIAGDASRVFGTGNPRPSVGGIASTIVQRILRSVTVRI